MTSIERAIFLKGSPLFAAMPMDRIRALAGIAVEASFGESERIYAQADGGDCLYLVVHGRVAIEQRSGRRQGSVTRLAVLGTGEYFGEASLFDSGLREADAVAVESTHALVVRRDPFAELIRRYPYLALDLLSVLSRRLQDASAALAAKTLAKPKELVSLYDKF